MRDSAFQTLEDVIRDSSFARVDLELRRGRHVGRDDDDYSFVFDALEHLEEFYQQFNCTLVHRTEGYFYLLPSGDLLGRRRLSVGEMIVGQTLALMYLEPSSLRSDSIVKKESLLQKLSGLMGAEKLARLLNPHRKKFDERIAGETIRKKVTDALRRLTRLGFIDSVDYETLRLRSALMRFADPVRDLSDQQAALERLVQDGEVVLSDADQGDASEFESDDEIEVEEETDA